MPAEQRNIPQTSDLLGAIGNSNSQVARALIAYPAAPFDLMFLCERRGNDIASTSQKVVQLPLRWDCTDRRT